MGSTVPLYYHRVFFTVAGFIYILLDNSLKATMIVSLANFYEVRWCLRDAAKCSD